MKKKTKRKLLIFLWLLVAAAFLVLFLAPAKRPVPKAGWRVPVEMALPEIKLTVPELKTLPFSELFPDEKKEEPSAQPSALPPKEERVKEAFVAIIIDDMGLSSAASARAIRLPASVTLSFLPYASNLQAQVNAAKKAGHEILLHMPMEPLGPENPGPDALTTRLAPEEFEARIDRNLNRFEGFSGVNNHMGSKLTLDRKAMEAFLEALREKDVFFIDSRTSAKSIGSEVAREMGVKTAIRDVFLDDTPSEPAISRELSRLEERAFQRGEALAIGHPHAATLGALEQWIPKAESRGIRIVPVGQLVR